MLKTIICVENYVETACWKFQHVLNTVTHTESHVKTSRRIENVYVRHVENHIENQVEVRKKDHHTLQHVSKLSGRFRFSSSVLHELLKWDTYISQLVQYLFYFNDLIWPPTHTPIHSPNHTSTHKSHIFKTIEWSQLGQDLFDYFIWVIWHDTTHQPTQPPIGGGVSTNHKSSNRVWIISISLRFLLIWHDPIHQLTRQPTHILIHLPTGRDVSTNHKSSNRFKLSWLGQDLFHF